ncbi:P-loop containing nucleoside triphosphate hydrolase protein, partial [Mycena olivaceomarginata]
RPSLSIMSPPSKSSTELKTRTVPMRVLVLGFPCTGTSSMRDALRMLGYNDTHHMDSVFRDPSQIWPWTAAIYDMIYGKGKPYGRAEWDSLLGDCQARYPRAVTNLPSILFAEALIDAYPEAKVILTLREADAWYISYNNNIGSILRSPHVPILQVHSTRASKNGCAALLGKEDTSKDEAKACFVAHYDRVRSLVPPELLLEYRVGEGWPRLCEFLGDGVPAEDFPNTNDTRMIRARVADAVGWCVAEWR